MSRVGDARLATLDQHPGSQAQTQADALEERRV